MVRDLDGNKIKNKRYLQYIELMEKYYIYNNNVYQIIRAIQNYKLDGGWYIEALIKNVKTNKRKMLTLKREIFLNKKLYTKKPNNIKKRESIK
jgi:hypothetical protein